MQLERHGMPTGAAAKFQKDALTLTRVGFPIRTPLHLVDAIRSAVSDRPCDGEELLTAMPPDIWLSQKPIAAHTDGTQEGLVTYGVVLINDAMNTLVHDGISYLVPAGTLYRFDGRISHETRGAPGLFAALIWDMPPVWELPDFAAELLKDPRFSRT